MLEVLLDFLNCTSRCTNGTVVLLEVLLALLKVLLVVLEVLMVNFVEFFLTNIWTF